MARESRECSVEFVGRDFLVYHEGDDLVVMQIELLSGVTCDYLLYADSVLRWRTPGGDRRVGEVERERIIRQVVSLLQRDGVSVRVEDTDGIAHTGSEEERFRQMIEMFERTVRMLRK